MKIRIWNPTLVAYEQASQPSLVDPKAELATGVRDSSGIEIFEGDILQQNMSTSLSNSGQKPNVGSVYYSRGGFFVEGGAPLWDYLTDEEDQIDEYRIIGNKHETPELLTVSLEA